MTRSVKNFHFFLTLKPDLNFSYLKLKTFIYEALIYHQWMCIRLPGTSKCLLCKQTPFTKHLIFFFKLLKILPYTFFHGKLTWR